MVRLTFSSSDLKKHGPRIDVVFYRTKGEEKYVSLHSKKIPSYRTRALIDTGSDTYLISEDIPKKLGVTPNLGQRIGTANQSGVIARNYLMEIEIPNLPIPRFSYNFITIKRKKGAAECLIGRDFLEGKLFIYDDNADNFILQF